MVEKDDFEDFERRNRLYHNAFEQCDSLRITYMKFYTASDAFNKRGRVLTYGSTVFGGVLLFIIGSVIWTDVAAWWTNIAFGLSIIVAAISVINAVDNPHSVSNVCYNSGQTLQRVFLEFKYLVTVRIPDPNENLDELEEEFEKLIERKHTVNETTLQLGDKWYHRVKESRTRWEPIPLAEITGEDGEFEVPEGRGKGEKRIVVSAKSALISPIKQFIRWFGY